MGPSSWIYPHLAPDVLPHIWKWWTLFYSLPLIPCLTAIQLKIHFFQLIDWPHLFRSPPIELCGRVSCQFQITACCWRAEPVVFICSDSWLRPPGSRTVTLQSLPGIWHLPRLSTFVCVHMYMHVHMYMNIYIFMCTSSAVNKVDMKWRNEVSSIPHSIFCPFFSAPCVLRNNTIISVKRHKT